MVRIRVGPRLTIAEQKSRNPEFRGRKLAVEARLPEARRRIVRANDLDVNYEGRVNDLVATTLSRARIPTPLSIPEMVKVSESLAIMRDELTVGQFRRFVERTGYKIEGSFADALERILLNGKDSEALVWVNLYDARAYAKWLSKKTGRNFRVQTEAEWLQARDQLSGKNATMTETKHGKHDGAYISRFLKSSRGGGSYFPGHSFLYQAIRLVEDK